jgi:homoserine kinase type II
VTIPLSQAELVKALRHYSLGELRAAQRIERGFVNENWLVTTEHGRFFLKRRHPDLRQPEVIRAQHHLMQRLWQSGFPAPLLVPTISGESLLILEGEFYEIQGYIAAEPYDHNRLAHLEEAALTLGRYHARVQGFAPHALRQLGQLYAPGMAQAALTRLTSALGLDQDPALGPVLDQLQGHVADLVTRFAKHGPLPHLVIHGDYYAGNLLFEGGRIVGVVDYDKARWQPRVVELAEALIYFASPRPGPLQHLVYAGWLNLKPFVHFLQCYARVITPSENELHALPDYIRCIWLQVSLTHMLQQSFRPPGISGALQELLLLVDWAATNTHAIFEIGHTSVLPDPLWSDSPSGPSVIQLETDVP